MIDIVDDLSKLTTIPRDKLDKLVEKVKYIITDAVCENSVKVNIDLDIGIGILQIINTDCIRYKFKPSPKFEKAIYEAIVNNKNILQDTLEKTLAQRITRVYKDII